MYDYSYSISTKTAVSGKNNRKYVIITRSYTTCRKPFPMGQVFYTLSLTPYSLAGGIKRGEAHLFYIKKRKKEPTPNGLIILTLALGL